MRIGVMLRTIDEQQGIGIYSRNLMDEMLAQDRKNEYVLFYRNLGYIGRYQQYDNVKEVMVSAKNKMLWDQWAILKAIKGENLDVLFHTKFTLPFLAKCRCVMSVHGMSWFVHPELYENKLDLAYIKMVMPLYSRKSTFIVSNSDLTTNDYIRILKVPKEKIQTVRLGFNRDFKPVTDQAVLDSARDRYKLPEKFIFSVVKYDPRKNFKTLIEAFRELRKRIPAKLVVAGIGCEKYRDEYEMNQDGIADDVTFLGWVEQTDLPALYTLAHNLFFPSVYEEFGIPTCEAMACGCPPVISNTGALPEIALDSGLTADPFDAVGFADQLERIWTNDKLHDDLREKSIARSADFTWERCARETLECLEKAGGL